MMGGRARRGLEGGQERMGGGEREDGRERGEDGNWE